jgi:ankyrin repeat protein
MSFESDVRAKLGRLPRDLEQTYNEIYDAIMSEEEHAHQIAQYVLLWIMSAFRPLSPQEMCSALNWSGVEEAVSLEVLLKICHNLVIVDHELNVLRLTHLSVREYFEKYHHSEAEGHTLAAEAFFWKYNRATVSIDYFGEGDSEDAIAQYLLVYWPFHTQKSELATKDSSLSSKLIAFLGDDGYARPAFRKWHENAIAFIGTLPPRDRYRCKLYRFIKRIESEPPSPLPLASLFGFSEYYKHILLSGPKLFVNSRNKQGETMLTLAAREGHDTLASLLVESGADVNATITRLYNDYANVLQAAAVGGHFDTVKLLLDSGASVNAEGGRHASALQAAAYFGHEKVAWLLHTKGSKTKLGKGHFGHAIQAAAYSGSEGLVKYLVEAGDDVNDFAGKYGTPLASAVYKGHWRMVDLLLKMGAEVNMSIGAFGSAMHLACLWGQERIVHVLLKAGADLNALDHSGRIPLHDAVSKGQNHLLPLLIKLSKNPRTMDDNGWTPLDEAIWRGRDDIEAIFADHGIYASQIPDDCILRSKDRQTLVKSALELAFHDMRREESWLEYALPNLRYSFFYLKKNDIAHRACQEISARWGWVCDSCRRTCDGEPQFVCTDCFSTDLCSECFECREKDMLSLPTCHLGHDFVPIDLEISGLTLWDWLNDAQDIFDSIMEFRKFPLHPQQMPIIRQTAARF